jgi:hypothetical protein
MKQRKAAPSLDRLMEVLDYSPQTGKFTWKQKTGARSVIGSEAGCVDAYGALKVSLDGELYPAHFLAWLYTNGEWPTKVKHVNGNKLDNRIENLFSVDKGKSSKPLSMERLREILEYDPETGNFIWKTATSSRNPVGSIAGTVTSAGYREVCIDWKRYLIHRLAWFWTHGVWPHEIDHINRDRLDNRIANLREAERSQNNLNTKTRRDNSSGVRGVTWHAQNKKWRAVYHKNGKQISLGLFDDIEEAAKAYSEAVAKAYGEFATKQ